MWRVWAVHRPFCGLQNWNWSRHAHRGEVVAKVNDIIRIRAVIVDAGCHEEGVRYGTKVVNIIGEKKVRGNDGIVPGEEGDRLPRTICSATGRSWIKYGRTSSQSVLISVF